jgi:hypothetical protein
MSAGNVITQIRRKQGRFDFIPAYSTDVLLQGVCHIVAMPKPEPVTDESDIGCIDFPNLYEGHKHMQARSRAKFEANREEIYMLLAQGRGLRGVANRFRIGYKALQRYLEEESK